MIWVIFILFSTQASAINFWISVSDTLELNLLDYIAPIISQLALTGFYNVSGIPYPTISQSFKQIAAYSTSARGNQNALIVTNNILYTSYAAGVYEFNITNPQSIPSPTKIPFAQSPPEFLDSVNLSTGNFLVSVEASAMFRVVNLTSNSEIISLRMKLTIPNLDNAIFYNDGQYIWTILTNSTNMMILQTDLLVAFKTVSYLNLTLENFNNLIGSFENFVFYQGLYYACNESIVFNMSSALSGASVIPYVYKFDRKQQIGSFMECSLNGQILSYSTSQVLLIYSFPSFEFIAEHKGQYPNAVSGLSFAISNTGSTFTVMSNNVSGLAQIFRDFGTLYGWFLLNETTVLINTADVLTFYSLSLPTATFSPALTNCQFQGAVFQTEFSWPIYLTASNAPTILQYTTATHLRDYSNEVNYFSYIPLSNFIKGSNLTFTLGANYGLFTPIPSFSSVSTVPYSVENSNDFLALTTLNIEEKAFGQTVLSTISLSDYLIYVYSNIIRVAYYSAGSYKSFINIYPQTGNSISCAAVFNSTVLVIENYYLTNSKYYISYDFYNLNGQYINNVNVSSFSASTLNYPSIKMALPTNSSIFTVNNAGFFSVYFDNQYSAYKTSYQSGMNLVDITACNGDLCGVGANSFLYVNTTDYSSNIIIVTESNTYIKILAVQDFVLVVGNQYVYQYPISSQPFWNNLFSLWPLPCNLTDPSLFLSSSKQFFSIQCQGYLSVYDIYAEPYLNPYLSIAFSSNLYLSSDTFMPSYGYTVSSGGTTTSYSLCPTFQTNITVDNPNSCNYWGVYNSSLNSTSMVDSLKISAINSIGSLSDSASLTIINSNYILPNKTFNPNTSSLTSGTIDVKKSSFSSGVPTNAVIGNNITYSLNVDGAGIFPKSSCTNYSLFCIESQAYTSGLVFSSPADEFSVSGNSIAVLSNSNLYVYLLNSSSGSQFKLMCSSCSQINMLPSGREVVGYSDSNYPAIFYLFIQNPDMSTVVTIPIDSEPLWMISDYYLESNYIYAYDGASILGLKFVPTIEQMACYITNLNFQGAFNPVGAYYWTDSSTLVVDQFTGIFEVENFGNSTAAILYSYDSLYSVAGTLIYSDILVLFTSTADVYFLNYTSLELIGTYLNPTPSTFYQLYAKATYNHETNLLAYVVSISSNSGYIRVLNCSDMLSLIDYYIDFMPQQIPASVGFIQNNAAIQAYYLTSQGVQALTVRSNVNVYVESYKKKYDSVMRLIAVSGGTLMVFNSVNITYPYSSHSSGVSLEKIYNKWWFWLIILTQSSLL